MGKNLHVIIGMPVRAMPNQEANSFYVKRDKMVDGTPRRLCMSHSPFDGANFCGEETDHSKSSGEQIWKLIWNKQKIIVWSHWPYIYDK